ncbi:hypothetical protein Cgig2_008393 [Carnegiea gigantea]|uniref:Uncharacterized protein n=1 Tax=Carnegiea gigantea TaxID=171969 RepID=A0A9Q1QHQ4_9CARY|nr:hypothetical protein Cgig2_008393 [Carnegiea gigantea]
MARLPQFQAWGSLAALVKPSHFSSKRSENSLVLGGTFTDIHLSSTGLRRLSWMMIRKGSIGVILSVLVQVLSLIIVRTTLSWSTIALIGLNVSADLDFDNLPDSKIMFHHYHMLTRCGIGFQVLLPGRCNLLERNTNRASREWVSKVFISSTCSPHTSDSKRKQSDLSNINISKDENLIVQFGKSLEPFVSLIEDGSSYVRIPGIDITSPAIPIPTIPIQIIVTNDIEEHFKSSLTEICRQKSKSMVNASIIGQDKLPIRVCELSTRNVIDLPLEGDENIMDLLDAEPNPTESMGETDNVNFKEELSRIPLPSRSQCSLSIERIPSFGRDLFDSRLRLDGSKCICSPNDDKVESIHRANAPSLVKAILDKVSRTPFDGLPSLKGDFDSLYATIIQRGVNVTLLQSRVKGTYNRAPSVEHLLKNKIAVAWRCGKLDKASHRLNIKGNHYETKAAELKQGHIDIINTTEVVDVATKVSLEKTKAYKKESFEDLKNFQWNP